MLSIYVTLNIGQPGSFLSSLEEPVGFAPSPNEVSEELVASQENAEEVTTRTGQHGFTL